VRALLRRKWGLSVYLVIFIFFVLIATMLVVFTIFIILHRLEIIGIIASHDAPRAPNPNTTGLPIPGVIGLLLFSVFLGTIVAGLFGKLALRPIRKVIEATHKVAGGNFNVRLDIQSIYELEELSKSFNKMAHELSTTETLRGDFINNISHEFKTPIALISGYAQLLKEKDLTETEQQDYLDTIMAESERLTTLSTNILNLSKYEHLEIVADVSTFRIDEQLRRVVIQLEPKWAAKSINIEIETDDINFTGNPDLTQQVLLNLIDNAIKFSNKDGFIRVRLKDFKNGICLRVKDDGIGMDENEQSHIFDRFYQGDSSRSKEGHGLGLSIVKRIVDLCGGEISVHSLKGEGSEFIVWL